MIVKLYCNSKNQQYLLLKTKMKIENKIPFSYNSAYQLPSLSSYTYSFRPSLTTKALQSPYLPAFMVTGFALFAHFLDPDNSDIYTFEIQISGCYG